MFAKWSIRRRLGLLITAGAGVILGAVVGAGYFSARELLEGQVQSGADHLTRATANRIEIVTRSVEKTVQGLVASIETMPPASNVELCQLLERCVSGNREIFGSAVVFDRSKPGTPPRESPYVYRDGERLAYLDLNQNDNLFEMQDWYMLPTQLDRPVWSEPYFDEGAGNILMVTYSAPARVRTPEGVITAVVTSDVSLVWLTDLLLSMPLGRSGYAFLISHAGRLITHPSKELIMNESIFSLAESRQEASLRELGRRMIAGESGFLPFESLTTGESMWMAFVPIPSTQWSLAALYPRRELMAKVLFLTWLELGIGTAGFFLLLGTVLVIARRIAQPIQDLDVAATTLASGDLEAPLPPFPEDPGRNQVARLTKSFATMRNELKAYVARLADTVAAKERVESELRIAHNIQMSLVPRSFPPFPARRDIELYALMEPAREVGGDFYDFFMFGEDQLVLAVGDVSGKGIPAALLMAVTRSFLRSFFREDQSPAAVLSRINDEVSRDNEACMFVTLFCAVVDLATGECKFANGGHNLPFLMHEDGAISPLPNLNGVAVGALEGASYTEGAMAFQRGDTLFLYTDGVTEAMDPDHQLYGDDRMLERLAALGDKPCNEALHAMREDLRRFAAGAEQSDDITMLAFRYFGAEGPRA